MSELVKVEVEAPRTGRGALATTPMAMLSQAVKNGAGVEVLKELMSLNERWEAFQARKAFDAAMADAKALIPPIFKNRKVGFESKRVDAGRTDYRHEDLGEIARTIDPILAQFGLSYRWKTSQENNKIKVTCVVTHREGHSQENWLEAGADMTGNKNSIQAIGSTITFLQRYTLKAALGLAVSNDDDGKAGGAVNADETISEAQYEQIGARMLALHVTPEDFCKRFGLESPAELPAKRFDEAMQKFDQREKILAETRGGKIQ